jgi:hypothetical protein
VSFEVARREGLTLGDPVGVMVVDGEAVMIRHLRTTGVLRRNLARMANLSRLGVLGSGVEQRSERRGDTWRAVGGTGRLRVHQRNGAVDGPTVEGAAQPGLVPPDLLGLLRDMRALALALRHGDRRRLSYDLRFKNEQSFNYRST